MFAISQTLASRVKVKVKVSTHKSEQNPLNSLTIYTRRPRYN